MSLSYFSAGKISCVSACVGVILHHVNRFSECRWTESITLLLIVVFVISNLLKLSPFCIMQRIAIRTTTCDKYE